MAAALTNQMASEELVSVSFFDELKHGEISLDPSFEKVGRLRFR
jgi:hypothetical protein